MYNTSPTLYTRLSTISSFIESIINDKGAMYRRNGEGLYIEYDILTCTISVEEMLDVLNHLHVTSTERCEVDVLQDNKKKRVKVRDRCINDNMVFQLPDGTNVVLLRDEIGGLLVQVSFIYRGTESCVSKITLIPLGHI